MGNMDKQMHLAAQYLAAAGINFVPKKEDDSHTNLGFSILKRSLETHPLSEKGDTLSLSYASFSLQWSSPNNTESLALDGVSHQAILQWINNLSERFLGEAYSYGFHYELPYEITDDHVFELSDSKRLAELKQLRILAQSALKETLASTKLESPIRVWPHHFDSGAFVRLNEQVSLGFGMAIPDSVCNEYYFYISGYRGHDPIAPDSFLPLSKGEWKNDTFVGGVLAAENVALSDVVSFFEEAIAQYRK